MSIESRLAKIDSLLTPQRLRYPYFIGAALWLSWIINLVSGVGNTDAAGHLIGTDYVAFYTAGRILQMGLSAQLYDLELARQIQQPLYAKPSDNFNPYLNPPFYAWIFIPFASVPYPWSPILWMGTNLGLLWLCLSVIAPQKKWRIFFLALTWQPAFAAISFGQNAFLSLTLLCIVFVLLKKEHKFAAGLVAGLLLYKPQFLFGLSLLWILDLRKNWHIFFGMALTAAFLAGGSFWLMPEATREYIFYTQKVAANLMTVPGFPIWNAHSVQAFWLGLFPGQARLATGLHLVCLLAGVWVFLQKWRPLQNNPELGFSAAICLTVWITPYIMIYDWVLLLIPAILFWQARPVERANLRAIYAVMWVVMFLSSALTFVQWTLIERAVQISIPSLGLALIAVTWLMAPGRQSMGSSSPAG